MDINKLSSEYEVKKLSERHIGLIYDLSIQNPVYYEYCPPYVTRESIHSDLNALPPNKSREDKYYIGYFDGDELVAIMDLIVKYPNDKTIWIGLFMMNAKYQNKGIGSKIIDECLTYFKNLEFEYVGLAFAKGNAQAESFWLKKYFVKTGKETPGEGYTAISMQRNL